MTTTIFVCDTCRFSPQDKIGPDGRTGGEILAERIETLAADAPDLTVRRQSCLMGCERHCNTAITAPGKLTYVLGMSKTIGPKVRKSELGGCGGHAGEEETALLLHLTPDLVRMDRATDQDIVQYQTRFFPGDIYSEIPDRVSGLYWSTWGVVESETGVYGDPTAATAKTGKALFDEIVRNYAAFLREYCAHGAS